MRKLHPINKPQPSPEFAVCDIESMNWVNFIVIGHTSDGKDYYEFRSIKKYFEWLGTTKIRTIFAHFGGKFDFMFLIRELLKNEKYKIGSIVPRGSSILYFDVIINDISFTFRDSSALLPFSLKSIAENFGVETQKQEWDHSKTKGYSKKLSLYLKSDCHALHQCLQKFYQWPLIKKSGPGNTLASQAMRVFRTYIKEDLNGQSKFESEFCRQAYLGGRTEIFKPFCKKGPLFEYDVNSLYPYVMSSNIFPTGPSHMTFEWEKNKLGIYKARVTAPDIHIPVLGVVRDGKYIFPIGTFEGYWTSSELSYAKSKGYKIEIQNGIIFDHSENLFKDFITDLYSIRLSSPKHSVSEIIAKLLMNSSYGRFGINPNKENITFELEEGNIEYEMLRVKKRNIQLYKKPVILETFVHTAIAAFVTSYARIHMHRIYSLCGDALFYTDTDSLFTTKKLEESTDLGGLKLEWTWDSACFLLPKTYMAVSKNKVKRAMKGFQKRKIENFTLEDFKNGLEGDLKKFRIENEPKFATFKTALAQKKLVTMTKASTKQLKAIYNKRQIIKLNNELITRPLCLKE